MQLSTRFQRQVCANTSLATLLICQFELSTDCKKLCHLNGQRMVQMRSSMCHLEWQKIDQTVLIHKQPPELTYRLRGNGQCD
jgi:hypothetical protein